jgi:hypothetical protein
MNGKRMPWQPGDEVVGEWPRERLVAMASARSSNV